MKIAVFGDSWTEGYGLTNNNSPWPNILADQIGASLDNYASSGSSNKVIFNRFQEVFSNKPEYDLIIVGWSGSTRRNFKDEFFDFSYCTKQLDMDRKKYFENLSLQEIIQPTKFYIENIRQFCLNTSTRVIFFSVFDNALIEESEDYIPITFLEYMANNQGVEFKYNMPIFEFGWLNDKNYKLVERFAKNSNLNFNKIKKAIVEREEIRPSKNFLPCGHPSAIGHVKFANFIINTMDLK